MSARHFPARDKLTVCFAHVAYRMGERFALRNAGLDWFEVRSFEDLRARIEDVDVLLCSGLWRNELIPAAPRLAFIQSISAGTDQYSRDALAAAGIGSRLVTLAKAFDMRVIAIRRDPSKGAGAADKVVREDELLGMLPQADFVALTCPLTPRTENLIDATALAAMKPSAYLINVARGKVVNEPALVEALNQKRIAGAALDCVWEEPLPATSPLWGAPNVLITPHTAGETRRYEDKVIDLLLENLERLWRGETVLRNQFV